MTPVEVLCWEESALHAIGANGRDMPRKGFPMLEPTRRRAQPIPSCPLSCGDFGNRLIHVCCCWRSEHSIPIAVTLRQDLRLRNMVRVDALEELREFIFKGTRLIGVNRIDGRGFGWHRIGRQELYLRNIVRAHALEELRKFFIKGARLISVNSIDGRWRRIGRQDLCLGNSARVNAAKYFCKFFIKGAGLIGVNNINGGDFGWRRSGREEISWKHTKVWNI